MNADEVKRALYLHLASKWTAVLFEVTATPPADPSHDWRYPFTEEGRQRRIDVLAMKNVTKARYHGDDWERLAIEVKVSRSDFLQDIRNPHKQALWRSLTHGFAYAAPTGLIKPDELPDGAGLLEVHPKEQGWYGRQVVWQVRCRWRKEPAGTLPDRMLHSLIGRLSTVDSRARGYAWTQSDNDIESLRAEVDRLKRNLDKERNRAERERATRQEWQHAFGLVGDVPCRTCGQPLRYKPRQRYSPQEWEHTDPEVDAACKPRRMVGATHRYDPGPYPADQLEAVS